MGVDRLGWLDRLVKFYMNVNAMEPVCINPRMVTYFTEGERGEKTTIHFINGDSVTVYDDFQSVYDKMTGHA